MAKNCRDCNFTGLRDSNGKRINKGSTFGGTWQGFYIDWCDIQVQYEPFYKGKCRACEDGVWHTTWQDIVMEARAGGLRVNGNIKDKPELLE